MRFEGLDLNLLVALDILLQERSVTAASARLHIAQPSMSGALKRLRAYFGDELFMSRGRSLVPTPFALSLERPVREALQFVRANLKPRGNFVPAQSRRHFVIAASDAAVTVLLSDFIIGLQDVAPGVTFQFVPVSASTVGLLERGSIDFLLAPRSAISSDHPAELLFSQSVSCIACMFNEGIPDKLTLPAFKRSGHVVVRFGPDGDPSFEDFYFKQLGHQRRIEVVVYGFTQLPAFIVGTKRIATLQTYLAQHVAKFLPLRVMPPPLNIPRTEIMLQRHSTLSTDPGALWFKEALVDFAGRCQT
jgi:LysR family nod box-dependent transcriptional activator